MTARADPSRTAPADVTIVGADRLAAFSETVLRAAGLAGESAKLFAEQLVWRDLREEHPIGLAQLPGAAAALASSPDVAKAAPRVARESGALTVVDGGGALGQLALVFAVRRAIASARERSVGVALVRNSRTAGTMGYYPTLAIAEGMVSLVITNSGPMQPPWGGTTKVLGNQAFALGAPAGRHHPLLFDGAATATSNATINSLARQGRTLPPGVALDADGKPTTDPAAALAGMLLPSGGHKGYALSVFWEILTGALASDAGGDAERPSLFVLAIDPRGSVGQERFLANVDALIDRIHASPPAAGVERVYAPGERGYLTAAARRTAGIPISTGRLAELKALGEKYGASL